MQFKRGTLLVVGLDDVPRRLLGVGMREHGVLGHGIFHPLGARFDVHRAELPTPRRIVHAALKTLLLHRVADGEPVFDQDRARADQHLLELGATAHELLVFHVGAESHHVFHAGAVVPTAIEQHDLPCGGQMGDVALEIPARLFTFGGGAQGHDPANAWIHGLGNSLDDAPLAGGVATFEDQHDLQFFVLDPFLQFDQFDLQPGQLFLVHLVLDLAHLGLDIAVMVKFVVVTVRISVAIAVGRRLFEPEFLLFLLFLFFDFHRAVSFCVVRGERNLFASQAAG